MFGAMRFSARKIGLNERSTKGTAALSRRCGDISHRRTQQDVVR
jgi:hypothetical protein